MEVVHSLAEVVHAAAAAVDLATQLLQAELGTLGQRP